VNHTAASLESLSKEELIGVVSEYQLAYAKVRHELDQIKKLVFGSRQERFVSDAANMQQLPLDLDLPEVSTAPVVAVQKIEYTRTITSGHKSSDSGRMKLPAHLPRTRVVLEPAEDVTDMISIGEEITEELDYIPGKFFVRQFARPKYVRPNAKEGEGTMKTSGDTDGVQPGTMKMTNKAGVTILGFALEGGQEQNLNSDLQSSGYKTFTKSSFREGNFGSSIKKETDKQGNTTVKQESGFSLGIKFILGVELKFQLTQ